MSLQLSERADVRMDVRVEGSGITSRAVALLLAQANLHVALRPRRAPSGEDVRAYAINAASQRLLAQLRVWDALPAQARTPVYDMRIHGDRGAPLHFSAWQAEASALAWIVDVPALEAALETACQYNPRIAAPTAWPEAQLTVVAEGKASSLREHFGVHFERHAYGHHAVAARLISSVPHAGVAWQWFGAPDVLALLPLDSPQAGHAYALVWSCPAPLAQERVQMPAADFEAALAEATHGQAGRLQLASARAAWPLEVGRAERSVGPGWVLVGDAAHSMHPLAGQGLNVGLADVQTLAEVLAQRESGRSLGDAALLARYARKRVLPARRMQDVTDGLWHLFASDHPMLRELRHHGMGLLEHAAPIKRWLSRQAMGI